MDDNFLTGKIPDLSKTKLAELYLGTNSLGDSIPGTLGALSNTLMVLSLDNNRLTGRVPQELCKLTKTMTLTLGYNALDLTPAPDCRDVLDPDWMKTQTVPPTDILATAISSSSIQLTWKPIAYLDNGGRYEVFFSTASGDPESYVMAGPTDSKGARGYTVTNLEAATAYYFAVRTFTPEHGRWQRNDLWSAYSKDVSATTLNSNETLVTVKQEIAAGEPVSGAEVVVYRDAITVAQGTSDAYGQVIFDDLQVGDDILARSLQHEQPSAKAEHEGWSYRVYLTNLDVGPTGSVTKTVVEQPGLPLTTTLRKDNTLVLFNLVVGTDFSAAPTQLGFLEDEFTRASSFLYDVTDGQFAFGEVAIYDDEQRKRDADVRITQPSQDRPISKMGGIVATEAFTYTSSAGKVTTYSPGYFRIRIDWASDKPDSECDGFCRTLVHEFAHYALFLYDEYERTTDDGTVLKTHCTSPDILNSHSTQPGYASNASIMYQPYKTSELAMRGTAQWSSYCDDTLQMRIHGESDWETVTRAYADDDDQPEPPRWRFKTPATLGDANPGPESVPIGFTAVSSYDALDPGIPVAAPEVNVSPGKQIRVFLFRKQGESLRSISEVGAPITSTIRVSGLMVGDELKAFTTDASEFASQILTPTAQPFVLEPAPWRPLLEAKPEAQGGRLESTVSQAEGVTGTLQAMLIAPGGTYSETIMLDNPGTGKYHGFLSFDPKGTPREGYLWVWGQSQGGSRLEAVTTYRVEGAPGSHEWAYLNMEVGPIDRLLNMSLPENAVPTTTLVIVMPVFQVLSLTVGSSSGSKAARGRVAESPGGQENGAVQGRDMRTFEGAAYRVWASGGITETTKSSALTLFYDPTMNAGLENASLSIYFYNEEVGKWEPRGGVVDRENRSVSTPVHQFGIYALVKVFRSYLPTIVR